MPTLDIAPEKVGFVILKAREFDAKVPPFDEGDEETADEQENADGILENRSDDTTLQELGGFLSALNEDEKVNLVAIAWIGRGTFEPEEWDDALAVARSERTTPTAAYLLGDPLIADYLDEGMSLLGFDMAPIEKKATWLRPANQGEPLWRMQHRAYPASRRKILGAGRKAARPAPSGCPSR